MPNTTDIEEAGKIFTETFTKILDRHAPLKVIQNRTNYVPYLSKEVKDLMDTRNRLKKFAAESGDIEVYKCYQAVRNQVTSRVRTAKSQHYESKFDSEYSKDT